MTEEDPHLAERLRTMRSAQPGRVNKLAFRNRRTKYLALIGSLFFVVGVTLPETYSAFFGAALCLHACLRARKDRALRQAGRL